jgi:tetratricopeptide (TPR) repeat protein
MRKKDEEKLKKQEYHNPFDIRSNPEHQEMLRAMFEKTGGYRIFETNKPPYMGKDNSYQFVEGLNLLEGMKLHEALKYYEDKIKQYGDKVDLWNNLGVTLKALYNNKQAFECYEKALKINPQYYIGWYNKGGIYFDLKRYEKAIECFDKALELNSDCGEARNDRSIARQRLGIFSIDMMKESFNMMLSGKNMRASMNKGSALVDLGNGKDAIIGYSETFYKEEDEVNELYAKGVEFTRDGKYKEALQYLDQAIKINPEMGLVWFMKAGALISNNRNQEASRCVQHALKLDPNLAHAWLLKGSLHVDAHEFEMAIKSYLQCLRIDPFEEYAKSQLQKFSFE